MSTRSIFSTLSVIFWLIGILIGTLGNSPTSGLTGAVLILTGSVYFIGLAILNAIAAIAARLPPPK